jgi:hypothetical protein
MLNQKIENNLNQLKIRQHHRRRLGHQNHRRRRHHHQQLQDSQLKMQSFFDLIP